MKVILNKTTKVKGEFVLAGEEVEVTKEQKAALKKGGFLDAEVKEPSNSEKEELGQLKAELSSTTDAYKKLEEELVSAQDEIKTLKEENEELVSEFEAYKAENLDLLGENK